MNEYTPIMQQYLKIKSQHTDKILLFRIGDFYELFFEDSIEVSKLLLLTLTSRGKYNGNPIPMAGFPVKAAYGYFAKLMKLNKKVAICEQVGNFKKNGLMEREVVRILTPGTFFNENYLCESINNFIVCISVLDGIYGIAALDVSTGYFFLSRADNNFDLYNEIDKIGPVEVLVSEQVNFLQFLPKNLFINRLESCKFNYDFSYSILIKFFGVEPLSCIDLDFFKSSIISAGCLLDFVLCTQKNNLENIGSLEVNSVDSFLYLDHNSRKNLELFRSLTGNDKDSLLYVIDSTVTAMGKRLLRRWLFSPIVSRSVLIDRLVSVSVLKTDQNFFKIKSLLCKVADLERILSKVVFSIVKPIDLKRLQTSLEVLPVLKAELEKLTLKGVLEDIFHNMNLFDKIAELIDKTIVDNPPGSLHDGNFVRCGFDPKLDNYRALAMDMSEYLKSYQKSEIIRLNIPSLSINFFSKLGYFIEVPKSELSKVTSDYKKISATLKVCRYTNDKLRNLDRDISDAKTKVLEREKKIYRVILYKIKKNVLKMQITAKYLAILDVINSFASQASMYKWCEPVLTDDSVLDIKNGRHPVVEFKNNNVFIPNDLFLNNKTKALIITGSNMGGKSTYMRQAAIIILLSHIGSHVPADCAVIGKIDKIFTRIGAGDDLANSCSTFMLEMKEISDILIRATADSFILIDELGRGTGYFDGKALAFSIMKELLEVNKSFFLFSTHFYDLHVICNLYPVISKIYFVVSIEAHGLVFHYRFVNGYSCNSFGIEVAKMAGLPSNLIEHAFLKFNDFQKNFFLGRDGLECLRCSKLGEIFPFVEKIDPDCLSPREALDKLYFLKKIFDKN